MNELRTIKDLAPKMSDALQAMHDGLIEQDKREGFEVDMWSYLREEGGVCFGCAATCALQKLTGKNVTLECVDNEPFQAENMGITEADLATFECIMDSARLGCLGALCKFYSVEYEVWMKKRINMGDDDWKEQLPALQEFINELKSKGL